MRGEIQLLDANGRVIHIAKNVDKKIERAKTSEANILIASTGEAVADWYNTGSSPISTFSASWTVPSAPSVNSGQTIFISSYLEPASASTVLQPILQWGASAAGGGAYWAITTWYVSGSSVYFTSPTTVSAGQTVAALISLTAVSGSAYSYTAKFSNFPAAPGLQITNSAQLVAAYITLEAYGITQLGNYPSGSIAISTAISLMTGSPSGSWTCHNDPDIACSVVGGSVANEKIIFTAV